MTPSWWRGRTVFITGHTGFKGAWLCLLLDRLGAKVRGYSLPPPTDPSLFALASVHELAQTDNADVRDLPKLTDALGQSGAQIVFHLAAQSLVRQSYLDPVGTYWVNLLGTVNLLEAVRQVGDAVRAVVIVTTDKCYQDRDPPRACLETDPLGGHDPYSSSKACAELATSAYRQSFFDGTTTAIASVRAGNVIGGGDWARDRLIPDLVTAFAAGKRAVIRSPDAVRPWQFILDPLCGYLNLMEHLVEEGGAFAEAWNFGPTGDDIRPVRWIADQMAAHWANGAAWQPSSSRQPRESAYLNLDAAKAMERLLWRPRADLPTALKWTAQWYKAWHRGENVRRISQDQIDQFFHLANR